MKKLYIILIILILLPLVFALENVPVTSNIDVKIENNVLKIKGENLDWSKSLNISSNGSIQNIDENLELIIVRAFGNLTELSRLMEICEEKIDSVNDLLSCQNTTIKLDLKIREISEDIGNSSSGSAFDLLKGFKDAYFECKDNINTKENEKEIAINDWKVKFEKEKELKENAQTSKNYLLLGCFGLGLALFLVYNKYKGFGGSSYPKNRDKPIDSQF